MKQLKIKQLTLHNFAGITNLTIDAPGNVVEVIGQNGAGKSTIGNAITWLFFGKNMAGQSDFPVKTRDLSGVDHAVSAKIDAGDAPVSISRTLREKWTKRRGSKTAELTGHETAYHIDDVSCKKSEFDTFVSGLCPEHIFKLLSTPHGFADLTWQERRKLLFEIIEDVDDVEIAREHAPGLVDRLQNNPLDNVRQSLQKSRRDTNKELEAMPNRIDEVERGRPDMDAVKEAKKELQAIDADIAETDKLIDGEATEMEAVNNRKNELYKEIDELQAELVEAENRQRKAMREERDKKTRDLQAKIDTLADKITNKTKHRREIQSRLSDKKQAESDAQNEVAAMRAAYKKIHDRSIEPDSDALKCGACDRPFEDVNAEALRAELNEKKAKDLENCVKRGTEINADLAALKKDVADLEAQVKKDTGEIDRLTAEKRELEKRADNIKINVPDSGAEKIRADIKDLEREISEIKVPESGASGDYKDKRRLLVEKRDALKDTIATGDQAKRVDARISELQEKQTELSQTLLDIDKLLDGCDTVTRQKVNVLDERLDAHFSPVKFKMFSELINGGLEPTCEIMLDGRTHAMLSTGERIKAGLWIIRALSQHYGVSVPVIIDNAESITAGGTIDMPEIDSQVWRMRAAEDDKLSIKSDRV